MSNHIDLKVTGLKDVQADLQEISVRAVHLGRPMRVISIKMINSIHENFREGGRYSTEGSMIGGSNKWTKAKKPPQYRSKAGGERGTLLLRSTHLMRSIVPDSTDSTASASTNVEYAAIHNFGGTVKSYARSEIFTRGRNGSGRFTAGTKAGQGHTIKEHDKTIPARPYMVVQPQDLDDYEQILVDHILTRSSR